MPFQLRPQIGSISLHHRSYAAPLHPVVAVCVDGCDPTYIEQGMADGILPNLQRFMQHGFSARAEAAVPTFTNPNNLSIVTGSPPAVHGISGNYFLDLHSGEAVMMTDPSLLRSATIPALFSRMRRKVVVITAKDKLRRLLGSGLVRGICFSSEQADACTLEQNGIENVLDFVGRSKPDVYSAELSLFALEAGLRVFERDRPDLMYLSLSDYVQHKHAPGSPAANAFYAALDRLLGQFADAGALIALTADHGMNFKPRVIFLQDLLDAHFGPGQTQVICPITDPYVVHHGSLGSFVRVYCQGVAISVVGTVIQDMPGIEAVYDRDEACKQFALPADREADLVVLGDRDTAIGAAATDHDLSGLADAPLRSHGGLAERWVPFILSEPVSDAYIRRAETTQLKNWDLFDYTLNGIVGAY